MAFKEKIPLKITNNTNQSYLLSLLDGVSRQLQAPDNVTQISWDMPSETFANGQITLNISPPVTKTLRSNDFQGAVDALNEIGGAIFSFSGTTIYAVNITDVALETASIIT